MKLPVAATVQLMALFRSANTFPVESNDNIINLLIANKAIQYIDYIFIRPYCFAYSHVEHEAE